MKKQFHPSKKYRRKRQLTLILLAVILALAIAVVSVFLAIRYNANPSSGGSLNSTVPTESRKTLPQSFIDRNTASNFIMLKNVSSGTVLYSKNPEQKAYPASLTKLMTALVACDNATAEEEFTVGEEVKMIDPESSRAFLTPGTRLTLENLIQAMLLPSGNDAAYSIATQIGRKIAGNPSLSATEAIQIFCGMMNEKASALGCKSTHFINPDGIHNENHYTTASDMMLIAENALKNDIIARTVILPELKTTLLSGQSVTWKNSNKLVQENNAFSYSGATGLKTGSTDEAGYCLVASAVRDGQTSIAVVMGAKEESYRWEDASGLLDISFQ